MCRTETNLCEFAGDSLQEVQQINKEIKTEGNDFCCLYINLFNDSKTQKCFFLSPM